MTNQERIKQLRDNLERLNHEIVRNGIEEEYEKFLNQISNGQIQPVTITDGEWDVLLPSERKRRLLEYYHSLRIELSTLLDAAKHVTIQERLAEWLSSPYVKLAISCGSMISFAVEVLAKAHEAGIFYQEEDT